MFPCFRGSRLSLLFAKASKARIIAGRVSAGSITESIVPYDAADVRISKFFSKIIHKLFF